MNQVFRFFKDKEQPKILENAQAMKAKIDDFKPVVPLALSLRKKGMVDRHWDQISNAMGFDIRPVEGEEFNLQLCVDKGLLKEVDLCEEVGEKAFKEHNIEVTLKKMKADWVGCDFALPPFKNTGTCYISAFDEAVQMLDEHIVTSSPSSSIRHRSFRSKTRGNRTCSRGSPLSLGQRRAS